MPVDDGEEVLASIGCDLDALLLELLSVLSWALRLVRGLAVIPDLAGGPGKATTRGYPTTPPRLPAAPRCVTRLSSYPPPGGGELAVVGDTNRNFHVDGHAFTGTPTPPEDVADPDTDVVIVALDATGNLRWGAQYLSPGLDRGVDIAFDAAGVAYASMTVWRHDLWYQGAVESSIFDTVGMVMSSSPAGQLRWLRDVLPASFGLSALVTTGPDSLAVTGLGNGNVAFGIKPKN